MLHHLFTQAEQKQLKHVRRKIKNKIYAQESRKRKKDYVEGLEEQNRELKGEVDCLKFKNQSLHAQVESLHAQLESLTSSRLGNSTG